MSAAAPVLALLAAPGAERADVALAVWVEAPGLAATAGRGRRRGGGGRGRREHEGRPGGSGSERKGRKRPRGGLAVSGGEVRERCGRRSRVLIRERRGCRRRARSFGPSRRRAVVLDGAAGSRSRLARVDARRRGGGLPSGAGGPGEGSSGCRSGRRRRGPSWCPGGGDERRLSSGSGGGLQMGDVGLQRGNRSEVLSAAGLAGLELGAKGLPLGSARRLQSLSSSSLAVPLVFGGLARSSRVGVGGVGLVRRRRAFVHAQERAGLQNATGAPTDARTVRY